MSKDDFFIGWADTPKTDRRFFLGVGLGLMGGTAVGASLLAANQNPGGTGDWAMGEIRDWKGYATAEPYAMLNLSGSDDTPDIALLGCQGKCGVSARIGALAGKPVTVKGSLIQRGPHKMIAVIDGMDWIREDTSAETSGAYAFPALETLGEVSLKGEILDTKCWFGAMRPASGKVHKSCAALCIRGGLPPAFYVKDIREQKALMIMTDRGLGHGKDLLPFVADPVSMTGTLQRMGNLLFLDGPVSALQRL